MTARQELIDDLEEAIEHRPAERRAASLRDVTRLFISRAANYTDEQIALFDDVISRLVAEIEVAARIELARALAPVPNAPPTVIRTLAFDDAIEVAAPVLMQSERLDATTLAVNARNKGQGHLLAISQRKHLPESITDILVARGDSIVLLSTVRNAGARFSDSGFTALVQRSGRDDALATSLGLRPEIPRHHFLRLLSIASEEVRAKLEGANPQAAREIRRVVREITVRMQAKSIAGSFEYSKALQRVEALSAQGPLNERNLMALAAAGKFEDTVVALSQLARVSIALAERAILQERTELLLSLLKSIALSWPAVKTILQLRSQSRMMTATDVDMCLASYERLKAQTADMVVKFHSKKGGVA